jgi:LAO/AO transport system kinase
MNPAPPDPLIEAAVTGDRRALARLITLVESGSAAGDAILAALHPSTGHAWTTGLTGAPGAGKSTLAAGLVTVARNGGNEVAVVAVDPSSPFSGGAVLGDRVRMQQHAADRGVYIRSMASRGHLGGLAAATPRVVAALDGAGFPEILIETVGVGQDEVEVATNADTTVVVVTPGWGDGVQVAKAGMLEIGDVFAVTKADRPGVEETIGDLERMLEMGGDRPWRPPVLPVIATIGDGVAEVWDAVQRHRHHVTDAGLRRPRRSARLLAAFEAAVRAGLRDRIRRTVEEGHGESAAVAAGTIDPWTAARRYLERRGT